MWRGLSLGFWGKPVGTWRAFCKLLPPEEEEAWVQKQRRNWQGKMDAVSPLPWVWELLVGEDLPSLLLLALLTGSLTRRLFFLISVLDESCGLFTVAGKSL